MSRRPLPRYRGSLALSLAVHAGLAAAFVLSVDGTGGGKAAVGATRAGHGGPVWISLLRDSRESPAEDEAPAPAVRVERPEPVTQPAAPKRPVARSALRPVERAAPAPVASSPQPVRAAPAPAPRPDPAVARVTGSGGAASQLATARAVGSGASDAPGPPDWPGPGQVDRAARPRWPIRPDYPPRARREGEESTVVVAAWIDAHGHVAFSSVLESGGPDFDASAQRAVDDSAFQPARQAGRDVASRVALRIHFQLYD